MIDWTDAFDNSSYVPGSETLGERLSQASAAFQKKCASESCAQIDLHYGPHPRQRMDLFSPKGDVRGLVIFIHGGYWHMLDKSYWSHLAAGPMALGWAVVMPSYRLAPDARIFEITQDVARAIAFASGLVDGPVRLIGHSAGGHLVSRMMCENGPLEPSVLSRVAAVLSVSGIHDLRPLRLSDMNETLKLTEEEAEQESPALLSPDRSVPVTFWVGAAERPELLRQTRLIAEAWSGKGAGVTDVYEPGMNHFTVIDRLADADSPLTQRLVHMEGTRDDRRF